MIDDSKTVELTLVVNPMDTYAEAFDPDAVDHDLGRGTNVFVK